MLNIEAALWLAAQRQQDRAVIASARANGRVGVRNHDIILSLDDLSNAAAADANPTVGDAFDAAPGVHCSLARQAGADAEDRG